MRVLVFSQHFWPETFRINAVTRALHGAGVEVRVLTGKPNYPGGALYPGHRLRGLAHDDFEGVPVTRVPLVPRGSGSGARLVANYLSFIGTAAALGGPALRPWRPDIVFVYGTSPILQATAAIRLARRWGARVVTWVQDLWPESLVATGFITNRALLAGVRRWVAWIYRASDLLLATSEPAARTVRSLTPGAKVAVHPNPAEPLPPWHGERANGFEVVFAGNLGAAQGLETVLDAADALRDERGLCFTLLGSGRSEGELRAAAAARSLGNVRFAGRVPEEAVGPVLQRADALLATLAPGGLSDVVPSKLPTYLAAGRPILAAMDGAGARLVEEAGAGIATPAGDGAALAGAVRRLRAMAAHERDRLGMNGRVHHAAHFHPDVLTARLIGHFESVLA